MHCVVFIPCFSFPIDSAMSKRSAEISTGASTKKRLSAKQFVARVSAPSAGRETTGTSGANFSELEPVKVNVVKWVNDARYVFEDLHHEVAMYQYQVVHEKRPSILFQFLTEFKKFIQTIDPSFTSLDEFEKQRSVRVVMPGDRFEDVDHVGIVPWRLAFYAATGDTKSILNIISDFIIDIHIRLRCISQHNFRRCKRRKFELLTLPIHEIRNDVQDRLGIPSSSIKR